MTDETILAGFANLHGAMAAGFDTLRGEIAELRIELRGEMSELRRELRADIAALEHPILRRFDGADERLDDHERRITALESRDRS